jgi:hypothetical protein
MIVRATARMPIVRSHDLVPVEMQAIVEAMKVAAR